VILTEAFSIPLSISPLPLHSYSQLRYYRWQYWHSTSDLMGGSDSRLSKEEQVAECLSQNDWPRLQQLIPSDPPTIGLPLIDPINRLHLCLHGFSLLHVAVCNCSPLMVQSMLHAGADPIARSTAPLSGHDSPSIGGYLYRSQMQLELRDSLKQKTEGLWSLRHMDGLSRGLTAELRYREYGFTPLMLTCIFASETHVVDIAFILLQYPATRMHINDATINCGWTAAMFAAQRGSAELWSLLLDYGADVSEYARSMHGNALDIAIELGGSAVASTLRSDMDRRNAIACEMERVIGMDGNMAQDCVEICMAYAGLRNVHRQDADAPLPYPWLPPQNA
jgi:hypothetical protein